MNIKYNGKNPNIIKTIMTFVLTNIYINLFMIFIYVK